MSERKPDLKKARKEQHGVVDHSPLFTKSNYLWMLIGALVIAAGMVIMSGGKNPDPNVFDYDLVYSRGRITVAPLLIVAGLVIEIYAIFKRSKPV